MDAGATTFHGKPPLPYVVSTGGPASLHCPAAATRIRSRTGTPSTRASTTSTPHSALVLAAADGCREFDIKSDRSLSAPPVAAGALIALTPAVSNSSCPAQSFPAEDALQPFAEHGEECECMACQTHRSFHALLRSSGDSFHCSGSRGLGQREPGAHSPGVRGRGRRQDKHGLNKDLDTAPTQRVRSRPPCEQEQQRFQQRKRRQRRPEWNSECSSCINETCLPELCDSPLHSAKQAAEHESSTDKHMENATVCTEAADSAIDNVGCEAVRNSQEASLPSHHVLVDVLESIERDAMQDAKQELHPRTSFWKPCCAAVDEDSEQALQQREAQIAEREAKVQQIEQALDKRAQELDQRTKELDQQTKELDQQAQRLTLWGQELHRRDAEFSQQQQKIQTLECKVRDAQMEVGKRERSVEREQERLERVDSDLKSQLRAIKKEEHILEMKNKNLGFNLKRRQAQLEERKKDLNGEALREIQQQEKELEMKQQQQEKELEIKQQQHKDAVEQELNEMKREAEAAVRLQLQNVMRERRKMEKAKQGLTQQAEKEIEDRKRQIESDLQKQLQEIDSKRDELLLREMGVKAAVPEYWQNQQLAPTPHVKVEWKAGGKRMYDLLKNTCIHANCSGRDGAFVMDHIKWVRVWRIENPILWKQYCAKALELESRHKIQKCKCAAVKPPVPDLWRPSANSSLNSALNEVMLWHGTKKATADVIVRDGFDERVCSLSGLFGAGLYFAQDSCKSGQYAAKGSDRSHWFLLSRVLLGNPHYATQAMNSLRKAPDGCDSVVYNPVPGGLGGFGHHRELIVYDRFQAYPEYLVQATA